MATQDILRILADLQAQVDAIGKQAPSRPVLPLAPRRLPTNGGATLPPLAAVAETTAPPLGGIVPRQTPPPTVPVAPSLAGEESMASTPVSVLERPISELMPAATPAATLTPIAPSLAGDESMGAPTPPAPLPNLTGRDPGRDSLTGQGGRGLPSLADLPLRPGLPPLADLPLGLPLAPRRPGTEAVGPFATTATPNLEAPAGKVGDPAGAGPDADAIVRGATEAAAQRPPAASSRPPMMRQPGLLDFIDTALAGMAGGRPVLSTMGERFDARNATYDALVQRGATPELAQAIALNPQQFATVLPSLFSPRTSVVNNRLVDTTTGRVIADFSDRFAPLAPGAGVLNTATGQVSGAGLPPAPAGFEWVDPNDRSKGLRAIPGGPGTHISSDVAGRLALMENARRGVASARGVYERAWGAPQLWRQFWANVPGVGDVGQLSGEVGQAQRNVRLAVESALRTMTGAAAPEGEVARYAEMFTPNARDTIESARQKLDALDAFMRRANELATQGRTSDPPTTGGSGWVEVAPGVRFRPRGGS